MMLLEAMLNIEEGDATPQEILESWAYLIKTGLVWQLQGFYGRGAANLIENGIISSSGEILAPEYLEGEEEEYIDEILDDLEQFGNREEELKSFSS